MLTPTISKLSQTYPNNVYKVNVDVQRQVAARYGIRGIPSVKIFKKGEVMETLQGVQPENVYSEKLKYYMN
jgi:thioredoxin 1